MGLSLVELAIGRYPIPPPQPKDFDGNFFDAGKHFQLQMRFTESHIVDLVKSSNHSAEAFQDEDPSDSSARFRTPVGGSLMLPSQDGPRPMAIFELLEYIVNQPAPNLPDNTFSGELNCLKEWLGIKGDILHIESVVNSRHPDQNHHSDHHLERFPCPT